MNSSASPTGSWLESFADLNPVRDEDHGVRHFGDVQSEVTALASSAVVCPLPELCRIEVTGTDRAAFLHNFCTNDIKELQSGSTCEAFFVDVKAKVIAHGYIGATDDSHEIWMLPGDEVALLNHLNRYVITEDVQFRTATNESDFLVVAGPKAAKATAESLDLNPDQLQTDSIVKTDNASILVCEWCNLPTLFISTTQPAKIWSQLLKAEATPGGQDVFHHHRIQEGYPICGIDVGGETMAPEADRISQAICYTKGCYLGQEPIARLDALGHVNRKLYRCTVSSAEDPAEHELPTLTSLSKVDVPNRPALMQLNVKIAMAEKTILARCADNSVVRVTVKP